MQPRLSRLLRAGSFWSELERASACSACAGSSGVLTAKAAKLENPLAAKPPHYPAKAKSVIHLFMHGGPSHLDTFDPKPLLKTLDGKAAPSSLANVQLQFTKASEAPLMASRRAFQKYGQSGLEISDLFSNVAQFADDLAVIRSCYHDGFTHANALNFMNTGWPRLGTAEPGFVGRVRPGQ